MDPLGMLALFALLFLRGRGSSSSSGKATTPAARADFANSWRTRCVELMQRARTGAAWVPRMTTVLGNPEAGACAGRWIGIESGGNPIAKSPLAERGLAQVSPGSFAELGLSARDFDAMSSSATTPDEHAQLAGRVMFAELALVTKIIGFRAPPPEWGAPIGPSKLTTQTVTINGIAAGKIRHALPLLASEMLAQNHWRTSIDATVRSMLTGGRVLTPGQTVTVEPFKPSAKLAAFARGAHAVTGDPTKDLILRFLAPAAVIAHAELAFDLGAQAVS